MEFSFFVFGIITRRDARFFVQFWRFPSREAWRERGVVCGGRRQVRGGKAHKNERMFWCEQRRSKVDESEKRRVEEELLYRNIVEAVERQRGRGRCPRQPEREYDTVQTKKVPLCKKT